MKVETELHPIACSRCGILYALPVEYGLARKADGKPFYCPNGHVIGIVASANTEKKKAPK